jgi:hypothetical protein
MNAEQNKKTDLKLVIMSLKLNPAYEVGILFQHSFA